MEQFKSLVLLILVASSLFLTYQLWYAQKPAELVLEDGYEQVETEKPRTLEETVVPARIVLFGDRIVAGDEEGAAEEEEAEEEDTSGPAEAEENSTDAIDREETVDEEGHEEGDGDEETPVEEDGVLDHEAEDEEDSFIFYRHKYVFQQGDRDFGRLWGNLSALLKNIDALFSAEQYVPDADAELCLTCYFKPLLPAGQEMPWLTGMAQTRIETLELYRLEGTYWLVIKEEGEEKKKNLLLADEMARRFRALLAGVATEDQTAFTFLTPELIAEKIDQEVDVKDALYVPRDQIVMARLNLEAERLDRGELLKTFFVDYNLARVIEERDGGRLYTDGEKGLRVTDKSLQFSHPRLEDGLSTASYAEALRTVSNLISYHGGWPPDLRLEKISLTALGGSVHYLSEWMIYCDGYPLYSRQPTRILFNDLGLFQYTRSLFHPAAEVENEEEEPADAEEGPARNDSGDVVAAGWDEALQEAIKIYKSQSPGMELRLRLDALNPGYAIIAVNDSLEGVPVWFVKINGEALFLKIDDLELISGEDLI